MRPSRLIPALFLSTVAALAVALAGPGIPGPQGAVGGSGSGAFSGGSGSSYQDLATSADPGAPGAGVLRLWSEGQGLLGLASSTGDLHIEITGDGTVDLGSTAGGKDAALSFGYADLSEVADPGGPAADHVRIACVDDEVLKFYLNGDGGDEVLEIWQNGAANITLDTTTGSNNLYITAGNTLYLESASSGAFALQPAGTTSAGDVRLGSNDQYAWSDNTNALAGTLDLWLSRGAAGQLDVNATTAGGGDGTLAAAKFLIPNATTATGTYVEAGSNGALKLVANNGNRDVEVNADLTILDGKNVILGTGLDTYVGGDDATAGLLNVGTADGLADGTVACAQVEFTEGDYLQWDANTSGIHAGVTTLTDASATTVFTATGVTAGAYVSFVVNYQILATDGTERQILTGVVHVSMVADSSGTRTVTITEPFDGSETKALSSGTLTDVWTLDNTDSNVEVKCNATSSLTTTAVQIRCNVTMLGDENRKPVWP